LTYRRAEWQAIAEELAARRRFVPPGLPERVQALLQQIPSQWPEQTATLELDPSGADAVRAAFAALTSTEPTPAQRAAVAQADDIIRDHQRGRD
jgi:hypothetical protein